MEADIGDFQHPSGTQNQTSRNNQPTKSLAGHKQSMNDSRNVGFTVHKTAMRFAADGINGKAKIPQAHGDIYAPINNGISYPKVSPPLFCEGSGMYLSNPSYTPSLNINGERRQEAGADNGDMGNSNNIRGINTREMVVPELLNMLGNSLQIIKDLISNEHLSARVKIKEFSTREQQELLSRIEKDYNSHPNPISQSLYPNMFPQISQMVREIGNPDEVVEEVKNQCLTCKTEPYYLRNCDFDCKLKLCASCILQKMSDTDKSICPYCNSGICTSDLEYLFSKPVGVDNVGDRRETEEMNVLDMENSEVIRVEDLRSDEGVDMDEDMSQGNGEYVRNKVGDSIEEDPIIIGRGRADLRPNQMSSYFLEYSPPIGNSAPRPISHSVAMPMSPSPPSSHNYHPPRLFPLPLLQSHPPPPHNHEAGCVPIRTGVVGLSGRLDPMGTPDTQALLLYDTNTLSSIDDNTAITDAEEEEKELSEMQACPICGVMLPFYSLSTHLLLQHPTSTLPGLGGINLIDLQVQEENVSETFENSHHRPLARETNLIREPIQLDSQSEGSDNLDGVFQVQSVMDLPDVMEMHPQSGSSGEGLIDLDSDESEVEVNMPFEQLETTLYVGNQVEKCPIDLVDITEGTEVIYLNCGHYFHARCILTALNYNSRCPMCKRFAFNQQYRPFIQ